MWFLYIGVSLSDLNLEWFWLFKGIIKCQQYICSVWLNSKKVSDLCQIKYGIYPEQAVWLWSNMVAIETALLPSDNQIHLGVPLITERGYSDFGCKSCGL